MSERDPLRSIAAAVLDAAAAVATDDMCECGAPKRAHVFWEDKVYDVQGLKCPNPISEYRYDHHRTESARRIARLDRVVTVLREQGLEAPR